MPNKLSRNKQSARSSSAPRSAASLLQRIGARAGIDIPSNQQLAPPPQGAKERLRQMLPESLAPHLIEVRETPGQIVLFTESAVWAGRLKLAVAELPPLAGDPRVVVRVMPGGGFRR